MRLAIATVLTHGSWIDEARDIDRRLALMRKVVECAAGSALVVLPGGFFVCGSAAARDRTTDKVVKLTRTSGSAIAWGVDVRASDRQAKSGKGGGANDSRHDPSLTWYACLAGGGKALATHVKQLAYRSSQSVSATRLPRDRIHEIDGMQAGLIICGEILAGVHGRDRAVSKLRDAFAGAEVIVGVAHANVPIRGFTRWTTAISATARRVETRVVALAQHLDVSKLTGRKCATNGKAPRLASRRAHKCWRSREAVAVETSGAPAAYLDTYEVPGP